MGFPKQYFYQVRGNGSEWMRAWLTSDGCISIVSDYGNYGYWFGAPGGEFRRFLLGADTDYLGNKLADGQRDYKGEESLRSVKHHILKQRRSLEWSRDQARREWDLLADFDGLDHEFDFLRWSNETEIEYAEIEYLYCEGIPSQLQWFLKNLWPFFVEKLQAEIDDEEEAAGGMEPLEMGS